MCKEKDCSTCVYKKEHIRKLAALRDAKRRKLQPERKSARTRAQAIVRKYPELVPDHCTLCGKETDRLDKHHEDWDKPYEVAFLCPSCHRMWHNGKINGPLLIVDLKKEAGKVSK